MDIRNEIKSHIVREDVTMTEIMEKSAVQLADAPGYDLVWGTRGKGGR